LAESIPGSAGSLMERGGVLAALHDNGHAVCIYSDGVWIFQVQVGVQSLVEESPFGEVGIHL
jgi:hypothetical protein